MRTVHSGRSRTPFLAGLLTLALLTLGGLVACGSDDVPYSDPASVGQLALYDAAGNAVTSGSVDDKPFVHFAVSAQAAPAPYDKPGGKAALLAYQPRQGADPAHWGGDFLTGSTAYPNPAHPSARAEADDISLANYLSEFPVEWNGLVQLRMYLGAKDSGGLTTKYFTADIKVKDGKWSLVRGAPAIAGGVTSLTPGPTVTAGS
jgi:hypothetical protein